MKRGAEHIQEDEKEAQEIINMGLAVLNQFLARPEQEELREEIGTQTVQEINNCGSNCKI